MASAPRATSIDPAELARFSALAAEWWNPHGPMAPLHQLNPARLEYLTRQLGTLPSQPPQTSVLDIGCGAGLVSEPLAQRGYAVMGLDASPALIEAATAHAAAGGVPVRYRAAEAATLVAEGQCFAAVLALEIVEHVTDPAAFVADAAQLVAPGGLLILSTLNRTARSLALGIVGAEYLLRVLPRGTHDWRKFLKPSELAALVRAAGLDVVDITGLHFDALANRFALAATDLRMNYFLTARRAG